MKARGVFSLNNTLDDVNLIPRVSAVSAVVFERRREESLY